MWYVVSVFYKSEHLEPDRQTAGLWEEVFLLVDAIDDEDAARRAEEIAKSKEHEYEVSEPTPHTLRWTFSRIERTHTVEGPLEDGVEIFSRFLTASEAESLLTPFQE
jgi:Domain of unknown function (DUF4288)